MSVDAIGCNKMKYNDFVARLAALAPTVGELACAGLGADEAAGIRDHFLCTPRGRVSAHSDAALALLEEFDCSNVQIGGFTFLARSRPLRSPSGKLFEQIGACELDPLVRAPEGNYLLLRHDSTHEDPAAKNAESLLSMLIAVAEFYRTPRARRAQLKRECIERAIRLAGGPGYASFAVIVLGAPGQ